MRAMVGAKQNGDATSYPGAEPAWFALRTASRHEKQVHARLSARGVESFLPLLERWSHWKDRRMKIQVRLFSGYCFARFALADRAPVITVKTAIPAPTKLQSGRIVFLQ